MRTCILLIATMPFSCAFVRAQDAQSLGDAARQARQQKQPAQNGSSQTASTQSPSKARHVITNEEIPEQPEAASSTTHSGDSAANTTAAKRGPEYWKAQILRGKSAVTLLQRSIDSLSNSIHFLDANYENHVQWNERQREKQLDVMKTQLADLQKRLEEMQETARRQGYGSSVYDP
jgi:hypothetical protein